MSSSRRSPLLALGLVLMSARAAADSTPRIVALGDSLTSGYGIGKSHAYPAILQERLNLAGLRFQVVNAGVSGDTSAGGLRRLPAALRGDVRVLIVALGANDGLRGVPVEQLHSNLSRIVAAAKARGIAVLVCGMDALPLRGWDYSLDFHRVYPDLAKRFRVPLVPFMLDKIVTNASLMQRDRLHPNAEGARRIAETIWPYLEPLVTSGRAGT